MNCADPDFASAQVGTCEFNLIDAERLDTMDLNRLSLRTLQIGELVPLAVEQIIRDRSGESDVNPRNAFSVAGQTDLAHHIQRDRFRGLDPSAPGAPRTLAEDALQE